MKIILFLLTIFVAIYAEVKDTIVLEESISLVWGDNGVDTSYKVLYSYDSLGRNIEFINMNLVSGNWINWCKRINKFDSYNNIVEMINLIWEDSQWINETRYFNKYDGKNNKVEYSVQYFNNGNWENASKFIYTYDSNNYKIESYYERFENGVWDTASKTLFENNNMGNIVKKEEYNNTDSGFVKSMMLTTVYDGLNNETEEITFHWDAYKNEWTNSMKYTFEYDIEGKLIKRLYYDWNTKDSSWKVSQNLLIVYDKNGNMKEYVNQNYTNGEWLNLYKTVFKYAQLNDMIPINHFNILNHNLNILFSDKGIWTDRDIAKLLIYNLQGRMLIEIDRQLKNNKSFFKTPEHLSNAPLIYKFKNSKNKFSDKAILKIEK